jgi:hypothetical protein
MRPNFLFIGPDKSGSSWLFDILRQHPECYVPNCKDIYFFDRYYKRGMSWYLSFFEKAPSHVKAVGELSHDYLFSTDAARRIYKELPDVKIITCLRNPVDRTFSHYLYMIRSGRTLTSFEEALTKFPELIDHIFYYKHLSVYFKIFQRPHIKVLFYDNLAKNPFLFAREVFDFLHISFRDDIDFSKKVRSASRPRSFAVAKIIKIGAVIARDSGMTNLVGVLKHSPIVNILYKPYKKDDKPVLSSSTAVRLIKFFSDDISKLQELLGIDLNFWFQSKNTAL